MQGLWKCYKKNPEYRELRKKNLQIGEWGELCEDEGGGAGKPDKLHKTINVKGRRVNRTKNLWVLFFQFCWVSNEPGMLHT